VLDFCNGTSTIWQVKPGLRGTAANLVCFSGECTQPACLGATPSLGGSHAGVKLLPLGPPAVVTRDSRGSGSSGSSSELSENTSTSGFLLFPGWSALFPGTNTTLLHVTTCSDALHDEGWTGRHFVSSGNSSAPENWTEPPQTSAQLAATGSWRHSTSCVPLHSRPSEGAAGVALPQLRCMGYDLHCLPEEAPCAANATGFVNTTLFTLDPQSGE